MEHSENPENPSSVTVSQELDARGLFCPEPVMMLHNVMADVAIGDVIRVLATDPSTQRDFLKFCAFLDHEMLSSEERDGEYHFLIRKNTEEG